MIEIREIVIRDCQVVAKQPNYGSQPAAPWAAGLMSQDRYCTQTEGLVSQAARTGPYLSTPSWESLPVEQLPSRRPWVTGPVKGSGA
jgi:hypothetical protein